MQAPAPAEADGKADGEAAGGAADATASSGNGSGDGNGGAQAARACHVCSRIYDPQQQAFVRSTDAYSLQPFRNPTGKGKRSRLSSCIELYRQLKTEEAVVLWSWSGVDGCV